MPPVNHAVGNLAGSHLQELNRDTFRIANVAHAPAPVRTSVDIDDLARELETITACRRDGRYVMGTVLETTICALDATERAREVYAIATALDAELTTWAADGPLIRLNRAAGGPARQVPPELHRVLAESVAWSRRTGGAFDVSVGPLMKLWRESGSTGRKPDPAALLAPAIASVDKPVVVAVVGTDADPQGRDRQVRALADAGAEVHLSNAGATRRALELSGGTR